MKRAIVLLVALTALGAEFPSLRVEELRAELGRATEAARALRATVAVLDDPAAAQRESAVLEAELGDYEVRLTDANLLRNQIAALDRAIESTRERKSEAWGRLWDSPLRASRRGGVYSAWMDYSQAVAAREAAEDKVTQLARLERNLEAMRAGIESGDPIAGLPAGLTLDQARLRRGELRDALAAAGRVPPREINLVRGRLAEAEAQVRRLWSDLARETAPSVAQEPPMIEPASVEPPPVPPSVIEPPPTTEPAPQPPVSVIPAGIAQLTAEVLEPTGYGAPEGFEDDEQCTWMFNVRFRVSNGIPVELRLESLQRSPAEIQKPAAAWSQMRFYVPPETPHHPSPRSLFEATGWQPGDAFMSDLGPHLLTVDRRRDYAGTYRAVFSGRDANGNPVSVMVLWTSPGRPPVGEAQARPVPQPAPQPSPQPAPVRASRPAPGVYSGGLDPDALKSAREKIRGIELINLSGTDATIRVRSDGRVELEGVFLLTTETSVLLERGTTRESLYFDRRDTSFSGMSPGTASRLDLEFHSERNIRIRRTNRRTGESANPSAQDRVAAPGAPDKHESSQGRRTARIEFDPKTGDLLFHVPDGLVYIPDVPWRLRPRQ